ncbi:hypothetical protein GQ55_4G122100 [Panicum hallii var. hallii]|uniref:Uncharacterized protein n=1 Tax=Panicum hallii var. hallii TaxID=1504633 RepID=A0A2T7DXU0_9POAL|nr:hypothetical protein GQ55_4G122100 [Panicum hallii var. hallii]
MAKVLAKAHLNLFSPSPIPFPATSFPPFHTECIKLTIQNLYSPNQSAYNYLFKVHTVPYKVHKFALLKFIYCTKHWPVDLEIHSCCNLHPVVLCPAYVFVTLMPQLEHSAHHGRNDQSVHP